MTRIVQFRRNTTSAVAAILGAPGELIVDTTLNTLTVHDGVTTGGTTLATQAYAQNAAPVATTSILGKVRPDGTSVLVTGGVISVATVQTDGTSISSIAGILRIATSSNGFGIRTISTSSPSGSANEGDIWYQV